MKMKQVIIFEYDNYRAYLRALYKFYKETKPHFSYRYFSQKAGFRSPNFLQLVIEGKRNLSPESIEKFTNALKLGKKEAEFFRVLVYLNQARTVSEKKIYAEQLMQFRPFRYIHPLRQDQYRYYTDGYNIAIRELTTLPEFSEDPAWIAKRLLPPISPQQAKKSLDLLLQLGLLKRDESGRLVQSDAFISTGDEVTSTSVANYHRAMIQLGAEALDRFSGPARDISSVTMALSDKNFQEIKALIQRFRKELLAIADQDQSPEGVYQINFQLFPLAKGAGKEPGS
jgi:uncharacterized protein (TIGR02147 family)